MVRYCSLGLSGGGVDGLGWFEGRVLSVRLRFRVCFFELVCVCGCGGVEETGGGVLYASE